MTRKHWLSNTGKKQEKERPSLPRSIVMTAAFWDKLYRHLIRVTPKNAVSDEQHAFILASVTTSPLGYRFLAYEMIPASPSDFVYQSAGGLELAPEFSVGAIQRCRNEGWSLIEVHSHPFDSGNSTTFSDIDWNNDREKMPVLAEMVKEPFMHATMVVGQNAVDAHVYDRATGDIVPINEIIIVGDTLTQKPTTQGKWGKNPRVEKKDDRYTRQELFLGQSTQDRLAQLTVAIVGLGGLGSFVALELAHLGIGHLVLIDPDRVERSNLNRLIGTTVNDIGKHKVAVYEKLIQAASESTQVTAIPLSLIDRENRSAIDHIKGADIIFGCVDNDGARLILNQIAVRYLVPFIDAGSGILLAENKSLSAMGGQVQVVLPESGCLECRGYINAQQAHFELAPPRIQKEERERGYGTSETAPSVIALNGVIASMQVAELLFLLAPASLVEKNTHPLSIYSALERKIIPVTNDSGEHCPTCGSEGVVGIGDLAPILFASDDSSSEPIPEIKGV